LGRTGLSKKELSRVEVMGRVKARSLRLNEAAELMGLSYRQSKRIWARYRAGGARPVYPRQHYSDLRAILNEQLACIVLKPSLPQ
jgi:Helix-turn-helix domain